MGLLYLYGLLLYLYGYKRYNYSGFWILFCILGIISYPVFYYLKRRYHKSKNSSASTIKHITNELKCSLLFVILSYISHVCITVSVLIKAMDNGTIDNPSAYINNIFYSFLILCVIYFISMLLMKTKYSRIKANR